ncbi:GlxA family transcriptional regulator [Flavihumibacter sp.]|uniref:GlxA family transcriptional regulator n=1 Tax=Flavihumibacter sp. TaxID=1913981 RepID=UPI002FCBF525
MKTISILVPESAVMETVADPRYLFTTANQFLTAADNDPSFKVELVARCPEVKLHGGIYSVHADKLLSEVKQTDLVIIPAILGDFKEVIKNNSQEVEWIKDIYSSGAEIASLCVGSFLLAATGLLNGKRCSTHWAFYHEFREMYPDVTIMDGHIITDEGGLYSSGGANSCWNLLLHILEKYTNREVAILAAKYFAIDIDRKSQAAFSMFRAQKDHKDVEVKRTQEFIETNFTEKLTVEQLATEVALGRRSLERRFKLATGNTIAVYIQRVKIEAAKRSFEATRKNINEVMYDVGYTDTKAFRQVFRKITGLNPIDYRNKYNKDSKEAMASL